MCAPSVEAHPSLLPTNALVLLHLLLHQLPSSCRCCCCATLLQCCNAANAPPPPTHLIVRVNPLRIKQHEVIRAPLCVHAPLRRGPHPQALGAGAVGAADLEAAGHRQQLVEDEGLALRAHGVEVQRHAVEMQQHAVKVQQHAIEAPACEWSGGLS